MDFRALVSDAGISSIRSAVKIGSGLLLIPVLTRELGTGGYGIWMTLISFSVLATTVAGLHLHGALIRYSQREKYRMVFINVFYLTICLAVATTVIIAGTGLILDKAGFLNSITFDHILPVSILIGARILLVVTLNSLRARQRVKHYELTLILRLSIETLSIVGAVWVSKSLETALWTLVSVTIVLDIVFLLAIFPFPPQRPDLTSFKRYLRYGIPMVPNEISGSLLHHADKFLILYFLGPFATGVYTVVYTVTSIFPSITGVFNSTLYPNVADAWEKNEFEDLRIFYSTFLRWYAILTIPAIVGLTLLSTPILRIVSTEEVVRNATFLVPILAMAFVFHGIDTGLAYPLTAAEETGEIAKITVAAAIVNILANIVLIPRSGILGAAIATLIAYLIRTGWLYYYSDRHIGFNLPREGIIKSSGATAVMAIILLLTPIDYWLYELITYPVLGVIIFGIVFIVLGGVRTSEWDNLRSILERNETDHTG